MDLLKMLKDGTSTLDSKKFIRGEVLAGYDYYKDEKGISQLGEVVFEQDNKVVLGGIITILKLLFGSNTPLTIPTINEQLDIATTNINLNPNTPLVWTFDVGIDGCGSAYDDVKPPKDQDAIVPGIIPIRIVDTKDDLGDNATQYWMCKKLDNGKYAYYLKTFEGDITFHSLWKDSGDPDTDGSAVTGNPSESNRTEGIETFAEIVIRITSTDLREYFQLYDNPDFPRFSTMGLCVGQMGTYFTGPNEGAEEIMNTTQFSILTFSNEMLHFDKDLTVIYRVYVS